MYADSSKSDAEAEVLIIAERVERKTSVEPAVYFARPANGGEVLQAGATSDDAVVVPAQTASDAAERKPSIRGFIVIFYDYAVVAFVTNG